MYEKISEYFISPIYNIIFGTNPPCMSNKARASFQAIANWFTPWDATYIRVYGAYKRPHALPTFIRDKVVL